MFEFLRQLRYPKEFRIQAVKMNRGLLESADEIIQLLLSNNCEEGELVSLLKDVGNGLWRIQNRLSTIENPSREVGSALRFLEATIDSMNQAGIEIQGHTGEVITGGEALKIISYEIHDHVSQDQVIETIKPTIYFKEKIVQLGEVVVGKPSRSMASETQPMVAQAC